MIKKSELEYDRFPLLDKLAFTETSQKLAESKTLERSEIKKLS